MTEHRDRLPQENPDALPEHERRPETDTGGGLTGLGVSAEQRGPVNEEVVDARQDAEPIDDPDDEEPF